MNRKDNFNLDSPPSEPGPTGVRRVNIMPMFIFCGGIAAFLLTMGMVAYDRAQQAYPNLSVKSSVQATEVVSLPEQPEAEGIPAVPPVAERAAVNTGVFCNGDELSSRPKVF
jgi:hypothetical protein